MSKRQKNSLGCERSFFSHSYRTISRNIGGFVVNQRYSPFDLVLIGCLLCLFVTVFIAFNFFNPILKDCLN